MSPLRRTLLALLVCGVLAPTAQAAVHVAPTGRDDAAGTASAPVRSLGRALAIVEDGDTVLLAPGEYPRPENIGSRTYTDVRDHGDGVVVRASGPGALVEGLRLHHARGIAFEGIEFTGTLELSRAQRISVTGSTFTAANNAIVLRGARDVSIHRNRFTDVGTAIKAPNYGTRDPRIAVASSQVRITDNVMEDLRVDGIQAGHVSDLLVEGNFFHRLHNTSSLHNDGIQLYGVVDGVRILRNVIFDSGGQGILLQALWGPISDVRVEGNLIAKTDAVSLYAIGVQGLVIAGNTVWRYPGAMSNSAAIALKNRDNSASPSDAVVVGNIASALETYMPVAVRDHNLVGRRTHRWASHNAPGAGEQIADPLFVDPIAGDFRLQPGSPARGVLPSTLGLGPGLGGTPRPALGDLGAYS